MRDAESVGRVSLVALRLQCDVSNTTLALPLRFRSMPTSSPVKNSIARNPRTSLPTAVMHITHRELTREEAARSAVIKQADRGQFAGEEHDHGLSNVHKCLARSMMACCDIGPK